MLLKNILIGGLPSPVGLSSQTHRLRLRSLGAAVLFLIAVLSLGHSLAEEVVDAPPEQTGEDWPPFAEVVLECPSWSVGTPTSPLVPFKKKPPLQRIKGRRQDPPPPTPTFPTQADLQPMLEPVGKPFQLSSNVNQAPRFQGLARLRDWTNDSLLRMSCFEVGENLRVHIWGQKKGISLRFYPLNTTVAAYQTFEVPGQGVSATQPSVPYGTLLATDDGRNQRLPVGICYISHQNGSVVVDRGNVRILSVPLEGPVQAVFIEAPTDVEVRDLAVVNAGPAPIETLFEHRVVLDGTRPAELTWQETLPAGARLQRNTEGSVELSADKTATVAQASFPVSGNTVYEVIFQVEEASPGTGLMLLNEAGVPLEGIEFGQNRQARTVFGFGTLIEPFNADIWADENRPVPYFGPGQWVRLIVSGGTARFWISGDGQNWGRVLEPRAKNGSWRSIGLFARETNDPQKPFGAVRKIRLGKVLVRELDGLTAAIDPQLLAQAAAVDFSFQPNEQPAAWLMRMQQHLPTGCAPADWQYACVMQAFSGATVEIAQNILDPVVDARLAGLPTLPEQIKLLSDAALINRSRPEDTLRQIELWERIGRAVLYSGQDSGQDSGLLGFVKAFAEASILNIAPRSGPISRSFIGDALLLLHAENRGQDLDSFIDWLNFWICGEPQMRPWLAGERRLALYETLSAQASSRAAGQAAASLPQPVAIGVSRVAENFYIDLIAALQERQYQDVVRLFRVNSLQESDALVPSPGDGHLFVSLPLALRSIQQRQKEFAEALTQELSPAEALRAEQVLTRCDPLAIEKLALQTTGTPTAATACQWLGDRALANVDFTIAVDWYEKGLLVATAEQQSALSARLRLASAALGKTVGEPPKQPVVFGADSLPPDRFEQRVSELLSQSKGNVGTALPLTESFIATEFPVAPLRAVPWADFNEGLPDNNAMGEPLRGRNWALGNVSAVVADDLMIVTSRRRISALDLATGKARWGHELGNSLLPGSLRPAIDNGKIFIRSMTSAMKYGLTCIDQKSGRVLWRTDCEQNLVADPFLVHGRLFSLLVRSSTEAGSLFSSLLSLVELNPESGVVLESGALCMVAERPNMPYECQAVLSGSQLVLTISGAVICSNLQGAIQWQRASRSLALDVDPGFELQELLPPLAADGRLFLHQPGNGAVECLAALTGEVLWRRGVIGLQRVVGIVGERLVVKSTQGILALDTTTGKVLWRRDLAGTLPAVGMIGSQTVLGTRLITLPDKMLVEFNWIDLASGDIKGQSALPLTTRELPLLGPMVAAGKRVWCLSNRGIEGDPQPPPNLKRVYELLPALPPVAAVPPPTAP